MFNYLHYTQREEWNKGAFELYQENPDAFKELSPSKSIFHTFPTNSDGTYDIFGTNGNRKFIDKETGQWEIVIDKNGNLIDDDINMGTFNYYPPDQRLNHLLYDVAPYFHKGNTPDDPVTFWDKKKRWGQLLGW